jgi:DNA-directed RNA polymerase specialized sigma24 family protein
MAIAAEEVTNWIAGLSRGDPRAAEILWQQYFDKLVRYARRKLDGMPCRSTDEEDVALSAMNSFCRGMVEQRIEHVKDADDLWKLLLTFTARKACKHRRRHYAEKRGGGGIRGESAFLRPDDVEEGDAGIGEVLGTEPTPELACMVADECRQMLNSLGDETLRRVALFKLEGCSIEEISQKLDCVQRKLERIREKWSAAVREV